MFACESKANIIFRQQHPAESLPDFRFVVPHPQQFGQREIGESGIAGELDNFPFANVCIEPVALRLRTLVTPDQRRTQNLIVLVQQNRAMHLPGKPDCGNFGSVNSGGRNRLAHRRPGRTMPVVRILLCPASFWRGERNMLAGCGAHNFAIFGW